MKITLEEKFKRKLYKIGHRNKFLGMLLLPVLFGGLLFFHFTGYIKGNAKRFSIACFSLCFIGIFSSFSFPSFISLDSYSATDYEDIWYETGIDFAEEDAVDLTDIEVESGEETDELITYDASEILADADWQQDSRQPETPVNADDFVFDPKDWRVILINKQHSIPADYKVELASIKGSMQCDRRVKDDLLNMLQAARNDGVNLTICSPYRSTERQVMLFDRKITRYMQRGMSYMEAYQAASQAVTIPGNSEHEAGLAFDIVCDSYVSLNAGFGETKAGKWLAQNSCQYGFILRYPAGKEYVTGIEYEPWHFRYVGSEAAVYMTDNGLTLEELWEEY